MLYENDTATDRICKVQDVPLACPIPNLVGGLESNQEILLFTHLMDNCTHIICYWQFTLFCLKRTKAPWLLDRHQPSLRVRRKMSFSYLLFPFPPWLLSFCLVIYSLFSTEVIQLNSIFWSTRYKTYCLERFIISAYFREWFILQKIKHALKTLLLSLDCILIYNEI